MSGLSYPNTIVVPKNAREELKEMRAENRLHGQIVIEDQGGPNLNVECSDERDAVFLKLTYSEWNI